jgi:hypothetical protein
MKYKIFESEEGLENLGKIHPVTIYDKEFKVKQNISSDELNRRKWDSINAKPEEKAKLYRKMNSQLLRFMFNKRTSKEKKINYEPVNIEKFNEKHKSAKELFGQGQAKLFD